MLATLLMAACTKSTDTISTDDEQPVAVNFNTFLQDSREATRTTYPTDGATGTMDDSKLKATGFGVFAQYTGTVLYAAGKNAPFNFMWNQQVEWTPGQNRWTYTPLKYWPNDNQPADDQDNDSGSNPAQGSGTDGGRVSFFAYAPYQEATAPATGFDKTAEDSNNDGTPDADGIVALTANGQADQTSAVTYRMKNGHYFDRTENIDLLWAWQRDRYKTDGAGYTTGTVDFAFKHALSLMTVTVQGLFDHTDNDDTSDYYSDDRDSYTKILIESVTFSGPLFTEGKMFLAPQTADAVVPKWEATADQTASIAVNDNEAITINTRISNSYLDGTPKKWWHDDTPASGYLKDTDMDGDEDTDADDALALFNELPMGVSHAEVPLLQAGTSEDFYYMVMPNKEYMGSASPDDVFTVRMVYYVITYDARLELPPSGHPKYFSIVENDVTARFSTAFAFEPNRKYKLRLQPGLTTVKFDVTSVEGWDTPITLNPEVVDWVTVTREYDVK